jgi:hypothetical protein
MQEVTKMANDHIADDRKKVRLIDAHEFWNRLSHVVYDIFTVHEKNGQLTGTASVGYYTETIEEVLKQTKTVDAVEVCRCKDCKHYQPRNRSARWDCKTPCCNRSAALKFPEDGFCSYGERKSSP